MNNLFNPHTVHGVILGLLGIAIYVAAYLGSFLGLILGQCACHKLISGVVLTAFTVFTLKVLVGLSW